MAESAARLPAAIGAALAECVLLALPPALCKLLAELLRCVPASSPDQPFRVSVAHLMERTGRSRNTVGRRLAALVAAGLIERWQSTRGARRWGFRCAQMRLTPAALDLLGLQRAPQAAHVPKPLSEGNRFTRLRRLPPDLAALAERIGAARVCWLMACCRAAGRRLQEFAAGALAADSPAGYVLHALRGQPGSARAPEPPPTGYAAAGGGGDSRQDAREYLDAQQKAGVRTAAGRLAGLAMLRALRR